ncbi:MAG: hypothetical protein Q9196_005450 [Gyalolechia fulgens]
MYFVGLASILSLASSVTAAIAGSHADKSFAWFTMLATATTRLGSFTPSTRYTIVGQLDTDK